MPRIRPSKVAQAAVTSHRIAVPPSRPPDNLKPPACELTAWRQPSADLTNRNLGLALFEEGRRDKNWTQVYRSYEILSHLPRRDSRVLATLGSILLDS